MPRVSNTAVRLPEIKVIEIDTFPVKARDVPQLVAKPPVTPVSLPVTGLRQKAPHGMESGDLQLPVSRQVQRAIERKRLQLFVSIQ